MKYLILLLLISSASANVNKINLTGTVDSYMFNNLIYSTEYATSKNHIIIINSLGGRVISGLNIISYIKGKQSQGHKFKCIVKGLAVSMMATILQVCDKRVAVKNSVFMQHKSKPYSWLSNAYDSIRFKFELSRMNLNERYFRQRYIEPERYFGVKEALFIGYIDEVI